MASGPLSTAVKAPIHIRVGDHKVDFHSGCSIMEVSFPNMFYVEVGEIHFKNYYTAWLSIQVKGKETCPGGGGEAQWKTCVRRMQLMPNPHCDQAAEDYFTVTPKQMLFDLRNITRIRFILRQPSPVWKDFKIEDIKVYKSSIQSVPDLQLPDWLTHVPAQDGKKKEITGLPNLETLSTKLQNMWATAETARVAQHTTQLGRYDVDGSYDINLLSYT